MHTLLRSTLRTKTASSLAYAAVSRSAQENLLQAPLLSRSNSTEASLAKDNSSNDVKNGQGFKGHSMLAPFTAGWQTTDMHPLVIEKSEGSYVYDINGKKYLDALAGLWATSLGGSEPRLVDAAIAQLKKLPFYHSFWNRTTLPSLDLAKELLEMFTARKMGKAFFVNSGSEANDTQVKLVWYYNNALGRPDKKKFIARAKSYHGSTLIAASLSGLPALHQKFDLPAPFVLHTDCPHYWRYHLPGETEEEFSTRLANNLEQLILKEGPETIAAFIAEPVMGAGGVIVPPSTYFEKVQAVVKKYDILFIADEVICAFGRIGTMFGCDKYNIKPDLVSLAKALSSAYLPIGAVLVSPEISDVIHAQSNKLGSFSHGFTYSGHPVACAVAIEALKIYKAPKMVIATLEKIQKRFLWGENADQRKVAWVKWDSVCQPTECGGLGIRDLTSFNHALLGKWLWNMFHHQDDLWVQVLHSKYGGWRNLVGSRRSGRESIWWRDLSLVCCLNGDMSGLMRGISWREGSGSKVLFWEDGWRNDGVSLMEKYPRLYLISNQQQNCIQQMGFTTDLGWEWQLRWRRPYREGEVELAIQFLQDIQEHTTRVHQHDGWNWRADPGGQFSVGSAYTHFKWAGVEVEQDETFKDMWKVKAPTKAHCFAWRLFLDRLPTKTNLQRRSIDLSDTLCPFCRNSEEDSAHLFFGCHRIRVLWWESMTWANILGAFSDIPRQHYTQFGFFQRIGLTSHRWSLWWLALTWNIWRHRNRIVFHNESFNPAKVMEAALFSCWSWIKNGEHGFDESFHFWSSNLREAFIIKGGYTT